MKDDREVVEDNEILEIERAYYEKLYDDDPNVMFCMKNDTGVQVTESDRVMQNIPLEASEISQALRQLKNGKCPGPDGIPPEFYKIFWKQVLPILLRVYQCAEDEEILCNSQRSGVLNLIPKGNKDSRVLSNLHPITLLNADYKIIEKSGVQQNASVNGLSH